VSLDGIEQRLCASPSVRERIAVAGNVGAQRARRRRVDDDIMSRDPRIELAGRVGVTVLDTHVETSKRRRRTLARRRRHAITLFDELAHDGLSRMASCTEHDGCLRSRHSIQRRRSAKEFK
jgi:hypothetical protein